MYSGHTDHASMRILHYGFRAQDYWIAETIVSSILMFTCSFGPWGNPKGFYAKQIRLSVEKATWSLKDIFWFYTTDPSQKVSQQTPKRNYIGRSAYGKFGFLPFAFWLREDDGLQMIEARHLVYCRGLKNYQCMVPCSEYG